MEGIVDTAKGTDEEEHVEETFITQSMASTWGPELIAGRIETFVLRTFGFDTSPWRLLGTSAWQKEGNLHSSPHSYPKVLLFLSWAHQSPVAIIHEEGILSRKELVLYWITGVHVEVTATTSKGVVTLHNVHLETLTGNRFLG